MNQPQNERSQSLVAGKPGDDLIWTAYQYTADELPEPAARAFEALLETDQTAREALAEAVSLGDTIRAALGPDANVAPVVMPASIAAATVTHTDPARQYGWARSAAWVALGAAACLVLTMALRNGPQGDTPAPIAQQNIAQQQAAKPDGKSAKPENDHHLLAVLFPEDSGEVVVIDAPASEPADAVVIDTDSTDDADSTFDGPAYQPMPEATAPDWLIAAVAESDSGANE
jgi:hypothetical protein